MPNKTFDRLLISSAVIGILGFLTVLIFSGNSEVTSSSVVVTVSCYCLFLILLTHKTAQPDQLNAHALLQVGAILIFFGVVSFLIWIYVLIVFSSPQRQLDLLQPGVIAATILAHICVIGWGANYIRLSHQNSLPEKG